MSGGWGGNSNSVIIVCGGEGGEGVEGGGKGRGIERYLYNIELQYRANKSNYYCKHYEY